MYVDFIYLLILYIHKQDGGIYNLTLWLNKLNQLKPIIIDCYFRFRS